jgi:hypothetical protein
MVRAKIEGKEPPKTDLQLPPGFLEEFCGTYSEFLKRELEGKFCYDSQNIDP